MADSAPVITFLSDYGLEDDFVGVCHAVIAGICPECRIIDLSHGVPRHDVRAGAILLRGALPYLPVGVQLAVVDPDVGAERRAVALRVADDRVLVGPDNGLLWPAAELAGGVIEAVDIARSPFRLEPVSATFHGRDIFAPVAAHLAAGIPLAQVGEPCDPDLLVRIGLPRPRIVDGELIASAVYIDRFGNVQLNAGHEEVAALGMKLGHSVGVEAGSGASHAAHYVRTFVDVERGRLLVYEDAYRQLAIAVSHGNAAHRLRLDIDDELRIRPR
jgi:S-adenosyl-L-methionine hydrolase (adenosine-forming)